MQGPDAEGQQNPPFIGRSGQAGHSFEQMATPDDLLQPMLLPKPQPASVGYGMKRRR